MPGAIPVSTVTVSLLSLAQMFELAHEYLDNGWIIAESADENIFGPLREYGDVNRFLKCRRIVLFGDRTEFRMEKPDGAASGLCVIYLATAANAGAFAVDQLVRMLRRFR